MTEITAEIFIVVDGAGDYAAMGLSDKSPRTLDEVKELMKDWNLDEDLGFCKIYRIRVKVPVPTTDEMKELEAEMEIRELGMLPL